MPLDASKIKEYRSSISAQDRTAALKSIAKLIPKITIPVIVAIIGDALKLLTGKENMKETIEFLQYVDHVLREADRKNSASPFEQMFFVKDLSKVKITTDLGGILQRVPNVTITAESLILWKEAELWLEGWYRHTADDINLERDKKTGVPIVDKDGMSNPIDKEDRAFQKVVGLCKLQVAKYYGTAAEIIRTKISAFNQEQLNAQMHPPAPAPGLATTVSTNNLTAQPAQAFPIEITQQGELSCITVKVSSLDNVMIQCIVDAIKAATLPQVTTAPAPSLPARVEEEKAVSDADLPAFLTEVMKNDDDLKIRFFEFGLIRLGMTDNQKLMLGSLKNEIIANLNHYMNTTCNIPYTRIPLPGMLYTRAHAVFAKEKMVQVHQTNDPVELLEILFDMRTTLIGACSDDLLKKVNKLLLEAITMLCQVPQPAKIHMLRAV